MAGSSGIQRRRPFGEKQMLPTVDEQSGLVTVDPTWGTVQPLVLHPQIETLAELEVIAHIEAGGRLIDTRKPEYVAASGTIQGAVAIEWEHVADRLDEFDRQGKNVLFCNGPQCAATPRAVERLLEAGFPPELLAYYRGGIHDWVTLGYPLEPAL